MNFGTVLIIILIVAKFYIAFRKSRLVEGVITGLRPTVLGLIGCAAVTMAMTVFFPAGLTLTLTPAVGVSLAIFAAALVAVLRFKVHPILVILSAAALGVGCGYLGVWR